MSILKNLFAAVGAATLGAVAIGVVLGATTAMTADDDDFDLDELRDDAPCGGCRKCAEKNAISPFSFPCFSMKCQGFPQKTTGQIGFHLSEVANVSADSNQKMGNKTS